MISLYLYVHFQAKSKKSIYYKGSKASLPMFFFCIDHKDYNNHLQFGKVLFSLNQLLHFACLSVIYAKINARDIGLYLLKPLNSFLSNNIS